MYIIWANVINFWTPIMAQGRLHAPTIENRAFVVRRKMSGASNESIAARLGIVVETLIKHYQVELRAEEDATDIVADSLFNKAKEGDVTAQKWWLSCKAGWIPAEKRALVDATKELAQAQNHKSAIDSLSQELRGHLSHDAKLVLDSIDAANAAPPKPVNEE